MRYTIIEDCSPYYIRFNYDGIEQVTEKCLKLIEGMSFEEKFVHYRFDLAKAFDILCSVPVTEQMKLDINRVSLFVTQPGFYYRAHKDGLNHRYSLNYTIKILDDKCVTSWYSDEDLKHYPIDNLEFKTSRECKGFKKSKHTPLKSMVAIEKEVILFNTDIFHDFDNSTSTNERMVLTFRDVDPGNVYFEDAKKRLFG